MEPLAWVRNRILQIWKQFGFSLHIEEVKLTDFSDAFAKMLNYNALNCLLNNGAITDSSQLKFHLYHLRNTDQNAPYYNIPDSDSYIYVVFEQETGYMVSNCAKLQWELTIARGVSDFDSSRVIMAHPFLTSGSSVRGMSGFPDFRWC